MRSKNTQVKILCLVGLLACIIGQANGELKFVVELFRHGARGPLGNWYDSPQQLDIQGELTATGQRQHYNLGAKLREEYKGFLPSSYNHSQIYIRTSDVNRTHMSAASQIQGMFPSGTGNVLPKNLSNNYTLPAFKDAKNYLNDNDFALPNNIQVVPIHTQPATGDIVLQPDNNCKNYSKLKKAYYDQRNQTVAFINQQFNATYAAYSQAINQTVKNFDDMHSLESTFECDRYNGRYVPSFSPELLSNASYLTSISWNFMYQQPDLLRALNTPFLNQLLAYINPVVQNKNANGLKWVMFSAHDTNVHLISAALNFTSIECLLAQRFDQYRNNQTFYNCEQYPHFTSSLIFEVHQADTVVTENSVLIPQGQFYLRIRRDGKFMNLCERNSTICSVAEFQQRVAWFVNDFDAVCNGSSVKQVASQSMVESSSNELKNEIKEIENNGNDYSAYYISGLIFQQLLIVLGVYYFFKNRKSQKFQRFNDDIESEGQAYQI